MLKPIIVGIVRFCTWLGVARHHSGGRPLRRLVDLRRPAFCHHERRQPADLDRGALAAARGRLRPGLSAPRATHSCGRAGADAGIDQAGGRRARPAPVRTQRPFPLGAPAGQRSVLRAKRASCSPRPRTSRKAMGQLTQARPLIGVLSDDPSLRGVMKVVAFGLAGVRTGRAKLDDLARPMTMLSDTVENVLDGKFASFSWRALLSRQGRAKGIAQLHRGRADPRLHRAGARRRGGRRDQAGGDRSQSCLRVRRARAADRAGRARGRGILDRQGKCRAQRHPDDPRGPPHPVAGAEIRDASSSPSFSR